VRDGISLRFFARQHGRRHRFRHATFAQPTRCGTCSSAWLIAVVVAATAAAAAVPSRRVRPVVAA
jgi:hypothetical protein